MTQETSAKKDTQRLQRAIVDGLEDVKAQDIQVFNTEHLSPLFERVIVCSGTSNRQTKALAASVRDSVREAGFPKPRIEGEENGEWIIVDCGPAVAHIMQPAIRTYYHLEEIWGDKPVRIRLGAPSVAGAAKKAAAKPPNSRAGSARTAGASSATAHGASAAKKSAAGASKAAAGKTAARKTAAKKSAGTASAKSPARKSAAGKSPAATAPAKKAARKTTAKRPPTRKA